MKPFDSAWLPVRFAVALGPKIGNRIAAVAGAPSDASTYYAGAASGGNDYIVLILM